MDIRNDLYAYKPMRKEEVLKRRVSNHYISEQIFEEKQKQPIAICKNKSD